MSPISVEHIATTSTGGAGTAMERLNLALNKQTDIDSQISTLYEEEYSKGYLRYALNHLPIARKLVANQFGRKFTPTWLPRVSNKNSSSNIVHLHWVAGYLSPGMIKQIESPIVWTLHDMWPLTGGCHYAKNCDRFSQSCGQCPALDSKTQNDISNKQFSAYQDALSEKDIYYIAPSTWMATKAKQSAIVNGPIETIPNCLDVQRFKPINKTVARKKLSIPVESNVVLSGGMDLDDKRKGGDLLVESLHCLKDEVNAEETIVMTFGKSSIEDMPFKTRSLGWVDANQLPLIYSSADVMAVPSRYDNLPQIATEPIACGTPVVAFNTGGLSDIVVDGKTGFLVNKYDTAEFSKSLSSILLNNDKKHEFARAAREYAVSFWSFEQIAQKYNHIYKMLYDENF
jgi:glycosyltransferase involved in cell wall biosynthesis